MQWGAGAGVVDELLFLSRAHQVPIQDPRPRGGFDGPARSWSRKMRVAGDAALAALAPELMYSMTVQTTLLDCLDSSPSVSEGLGSKQNMIGIVHPSMRRILKTLHPRSSYEEAAGSWFGLTSVLCLISL
jgi:hypothetical protein